MEEAYYTAEDVSKNNGKNESKTWIIYKENVYDVTNFLQEHPGGADLILEWAGENCTKAFEEVGHSSEARNDLKKYKIGKFKGEMTETSTKLDIGKGKRSFLGVISCGLLGS